MIRVALQGFGEEGRFALEQLSLAEGYQVVAINFLGDQFHYKLFQEKAKLDMWIGYEKNIFPYQEDVDKIINSALLYELGVLKTYAEPLLFSVKETDPIYPEALRLINFLRNFLPIPSEEVPKDSVLREFIGNSCFQGNNGL